MSLPPSIFNLFMAQTPSLETYFDLARQGIRLFRVNNDPLTASAIEILFRCRSLPLTEVEQNAAVLLKNQIEAYQTLHIGPLMQ